MNIQNLKKSKKGFTLVEIIVVLVIIAILAAIAIPAMTGWIDKANKKAIMAEARTVLMAAQTIASEAYGQGVPLGPEADSDTTEKIETLAEVATGTVSDLTISDKGIVTAVTYDDGTYTVTYNTANDSHWSEVSDS